MPRFRRLIPFLPALSDRGSSDRRTLYPIALSASLACLSLIASTAQAQARAAADIPLHLAANRFEFTASGESQPLTKPLAVHNGGTVRFTDVRLTKVAYADAARGKAWLVALPRQTAVAPDELATVGTLCIDPTGLPAGTYRATAAVRAREVPESVPITITLVVTDAGARARSTGPRCESVTKK